MVYLLSKRTLLLGTKMKNFQKKSTAWHSSKYSEIYLHLPIKRKINSLMIFFQLNVQ